MNVKNQKRGQKMFKAKTDGGNNNVCGKNVHLLCKAMPPKMSQRVLAEKLQIKNSLAV